MDPPHGLAVRWVLGCLIGTLTVGHGRRSSDDWQTSPEVTRILESYRTEIREKGAYKRSDHKYHMY